MIVKHVNIECRTNTGIRLFLNFKQEVDQLSYCSASAVECSDVMCSGLDERVCVGDANRTRNLGS